MDDSRLGSEDSGGYWAPKKRVSYGPFFSWPPQPLALLKWFFGFPGYFLPWNVLYAVAAVLIWLYLTPSLDSLKTFTVSWASLILARNIGLAIAVYGAWHMWLYVWRKQATSFKYNRRWPGKKSSNFLFNHQTTDNMFWTLVSGVPIWTVYEVLLLWAYANGAIPIVSYSDNAVGFIALFFLVPFIHEVGFYFAHRFLHWPPLYQAAHKLHHRNTNPGPWSGLSMHPLDACNIFLTHIIVFRHPFASNPHDQPRLTFGFGSRTRPYRFRSGRRGKGIELEHVLLCSLSASSIF